MPMDAAPGTLSRLAVESNALFPAAPPGADASETRRLLRCLRRVAEVGARATGEVELLARSLAVVAGEIPGVRGRVFLIEPGSDALRRVATVASDPLDADDAPPEPALVRAVLDGPDAVLRGSTLAAPIIRRRRVAGIFHLEQATGDLDASALALVAAAAATIASALDALLDRARTVSTSLPCDLAATEDRATGLRAATSGDDGATHASLIDRAGGAAVVLVEMDAGEEAASSIATLEARTVLRALVPRDVAPGELLAEVQRIVTPATITCAVLARLDAEERTVELAVIGQPAVLLLRATGQGELLHLGLARRRSLGGDVTLLEPRPIEVFRGDAFCLLAASARATLGARGVSGLRHVFEAREPVGPTSLLRAVEAYAGAEGIRLPRGLAIAVVDTPL